ncbi:TlpA family protein disulfide reductase [Nonomuraea cavernae]|uniref:TlpA family protein n=1 Tax=Nonomuraea cavernae TaxID=2045107 RepID=A0A918DMX8_9ACTN|nr:hypothetical protein [Nonomuraea cavernae]MCA2188536.1 hypothetical protein [Nonomuraea cavernae]GGO73022.1 TlpA family protein [Nonomuraea cavernae]
MLSLVALVGVLTVLNLLLTFGVIRRLREHTDLLARGTTPAASMDGPDMPAGRRVAEFDGTTTEGEPLGRDLLAGETFVGFVSPGCTPCDERMPELIETARAWPGGRQDTMIVVFGRRAAAAEYIERLTSVAKVVVEAPNGPIAAAFGVKGFPIFGVVDQAGWVLRSGMEPGMHLLRGTAPA